MKPEYAAVLLAMIEADPEGFAAACSQIAPDDPETLGNEIIDMLSTEGATEEETTETPEEEATEKEVG